MPKLYVVRHGQTDWNAAQRLQGQADTPLNDIGRQQAARNGKALAAELGPRPDIDFFASPLTRARQTMHIIRRELDLDENGYAVDPRLMEVSFGIWQGKTWDEVGAHHPTAATERHERPWTYTPPQGESYADLSVRALEWHAEVTRDAVVVTHGGVLRVLRMPLADIPEDDVLSLRVPQDKVLVLTESEFGWI